MISDATRTEFQDAGYTLLNECHERDLISVRDGVAHAAGRLPERSDVPAGLELLNNKRGNLWWAINPQGQVILACLDARYIQ